MYNWQSRIQSSDGVVKSDEGREQGKARTERKTRGEKRQRQRRHVSSAEENKRIDLRVGTERERKHLQGTERSRFNGIIVGLSKNS